MRRKENKMKKEEAYKVFKEIIGWNDPKIHWYEDDQGNQYDFFVTAIDPWDNRLKMYNPQTGFFE